MHGRVGVDDRNIAVAFRVDLVDDVVVVAVDQVPVAMTSDGFFAARHTHYWMKLMKHAEWEHPSMMTTSTDEVYLYNYWYCCYCMAVVDMKIANQEDQLVTSGKTECEHDDDDATLMLVVAGGN
jgi:hypothetical protein